MRSTTNFLLLAALTIFPSAVALAADTGTPVSGRYVVTLDRAALDDVDRRQIVFAALEIANDYDAKLVHVYGTALAGFAATMSAEQAEALARDWRVGSVEQDRVVTVAALRVEAPRALDRPAGVYATAPAEKLHAYVIDTGLRRSHPRLAGRVAEGYSAVLDVAGTFDCHGNGTRVAGLALDVAANLAADVTLHPVRVIGCDGRGLVSDLLAGVDWVTANHEKPALATLSLGGVSSRILDQAVGNSIAAGVVYVD